MSENGVRDAAARRKRVQRLKRLIIFTLLTMILVPYVFCAVLMFKLQDLNSKVDRLSQQLAGLEQVIGRIQLSWRSSAEHAQEDGVPETDGGQGTDADRDVSTLVNVTDGMEEDATLHKVYLTFDDGPSGNTDRILDILEEYNVKATFFVVGKEDEHAKEALQRIVEEGHTLGMHSYSHRYGELYASLDSFKQDLEKEQKYLFDVTGVESHVYRFPGGSSNKVSSLDMHLFADYLDSQDIVFFDWNISSGDGGSRLLSTDELLRNCTSSVGKWGTAVILMHDSGEKPTTVEALPAIIEKILAMEDTEILPITEDTLPVQHIHKDE